MDADQKGCPGQQDQAKHHPERGDAVHFAFHIRRLHKQDYDADHHDNKCQDDKDHLKDIQIAGDDASNIGQQIKVASCKRRYPAAKQDKIHKGQQKPDKGDHQHDAELPVKQQCNR